MKGARNRCEVEKPEFEGIKKELADAQATYECLLMRFRSHNGVVKE